MNIPWLGVLAAFSTIAPVLVGAIFIRKFDKAATVVFIYLLFSALFAFAQMFLAAHGRNNLWIAHIWNLIEVTVLMYVFGTWTSRKLLSLGFKLTAFIYIIFWCTIKYLQERFDLPSNFEGPISQILLSIGSIIILFQIASDIDHNILSDWRFWIASSELLSSSSNALFYPLLGMIAKWNTNLIVPAFSLFWILVITSNLLFARAVQCMRYQAPPGSMLNS